MKILYVLSYISKNGGVQAVVNNYYNQLKNHKDLQIDFLVLLPGDVDLEKEIMKNGANVFHIEGQEEKNLKKFVKEVKRFFKEHHDYDIIHSHQTNLDFFYLREAKKYNIPIRIMHSHSTSYNINKYRMALTKFLSKRYANYYFACSEEAGKFYFGSKFSKNRKSYIVNNAIDIDKYRYRSDLRNKIRKEINIKDELVIGNIARMDENKNHIFLLELFAIINRKDENAKLLLIGDGPLREKLEEKTRELNIEKNVIFYGITNNVHKLLQAMDVFILPSKFEGVPLTIIEAASNGLKYYISDTIDSHLLENKNEVKFCLNDEKEKIADEILKSVKKEDRNEILNIIEESGFDIKIEAEKLYNYYVDIMRRINNDR